MRLLAELRRRNVIRMAGLYLVGAWLIVQIAETLLPIFGTPDWVLQTLVVLLALGFLPALVFSWVFELTPDGLKRDADVPAEQSIAAQTARRMDRLILAGMLALAMLIVGERLWPRVRRKPRRRRRPPTRLPRPMRRTRRIQPQPPQTGAPRPPPTQARQPTQSPCCPSSTCPARPTTNISPTASARKSSTCWPAPASCRSPRARRRSRSRARMSKCRRSQRH